VTIPATFLLCILLSLASSAQAEEKLSPARAGVAQPQSVSPKQALRLKGLDGVWHNLSEWNGKVVVLNFWATWCSPCLSEIPHLVAYQEQYRSLGLQIVGVGLDDERKLRNVQRTLEISYPVLLADPRIHGGLMRSWRNVTGVVPYTVVIDRDGQVKYTHQGLMEREVFDEYVLPLLAPG
jgi:thiol-disulfide isomerase/thioredoxin